LDSFHQYLPEYRKQLAKGDIKEAYSGLMKYFDDFRLHLKQKYPDYFLSDVHYGCMDYTYFYFFPKTLKHRNLKIMLLFIHETFEFQVWLAGYNKQVQAKYWKLLKENNWNKTTLASTTKNIDYIAEIVLVKNPDFSDLDALTKQIEAGALKFIEDVEAFLYIVDVK
jgi:hypothetical protein